MASDDLSVGERAIDDLLERSHFAGQHDMPGIIAEQAARIGVSDAVVYLSDLQQVVLVPFTGGTSAGIAQPLGIDGTVAGRCFQHVDVVTQDVGDGRVQVWLPMVDGTDRLGVLAVLIRETDAPEIADGLLGIRLRRFAALVSELITTKTMYGDTIVRLRRRSSMNLAAELQWSLLPPLTFSSAGITVAGALEPAYEVAGDTLDYAVDEGIVRAAVFDGMGHGLLSGQLATVAVAAYRNLRRAGADLTTTAEGVHEAMLAAFDGDRFTTAVFAELLSGSGLLRWASAGHPPPLLLRGGRLVRELTCRPVPPLGVALPRDVARGEIRICEEQLEPGDRVLLYTDGVVEARSPDGEFFGQRRLVDLLSRHFAGGLPPPETMRRVVHALLEHQQGRLRDDATMLLLEWRTDVSALLY